MPQASSANAGSSLTRVYREVTLLGQNVDSYYWMDEASGKARLPSPKLLDTVARIDPALRVRFSTSHPKDITDEVLYTMARIPIFVSISTLPVQSGSTRILQLMNRTYTREWYLAKIDRIFGPSCRIAG
jgi:tRNA-2-methylthio-N6-dimethylallyladenosine synthase